MEKEVIKRVAGHCVCVGLAMVMTASYAIFGEREIVEMSENKAYAEEVVEDTDETPRCTTIVSTSSKNKINLRYSEEEDFFARFRTSLTDKELSDKIEQIKKEKEEAEAKKKAEEEAEEAKKKASYSSYSLSTSTDGESHYTSSSNIKVESQVALNGSDTWNGYTWTYYSNQQKELKSGFKTLESEVRAASGDCCYDNYGFLCDGDGYIVLAYPHPKFSGSYWHEVILTPFGRYGKVYDCCDRSGDIDIATNW